MTLILSGSDGLSDVDGSAATPAIRGTDANTGIFFPAADTIAFAEGGAEIARFDSSGNLGIGIASPVSQLHLSSASDSGMTIYKTGVGAGNVRVVTQGGGSALAFGSDQSTGTTERMRIDSSGNVGIGTNSPAVTLDIVGAQIRVNSSSGLGVRQTFVSTSTNGRTYQIGCNFTTGTGEFAIYDATAAAERMRIDSSGNLILTNVGGNNRIYSTGVYNVTNASAANVIVTSDGGFARSTSSLKYKQNVNDSVRGLSDLLKLRAVTYESKNESEAGIVFGGLIAEEVHEAGLTEFVQYAEDGSPDALAYGNMVSLCINAIKELKALVDTQASTITQLQADVASLKGTP